ncbi:MAG: M66 family metalloprotease [Nannocystaceae bacterium]
MHTSRPSQPLPKPLVGCTPFLFMLVACAPNGSATFANTGSVSDTGGDPSANANEDSQADDGGSSSSSSDSAGEDTGAQGSAGSDDASGASNDETVPGEDESEACDDAPDLLPLAQAGGTLSVIEASLEFGQTHVLKEIEDRLSAPLLAKRATLLLLEPQAPIAGTPGMKITAWVNGNALGTLVMRTPEDLPLAFESSYSPVELAPYSATAWSALLPWNWVVPGVELEIGFDEDDGADLVRHRRSYRFGELGAPNDFLMARIHAKIFMDPSEGPRLNHRIDKMLKEYYPALPVSQMRWLDYTQVNWPYLIIGSAELGTPVRVDSEDEYFAVTGSHNHYGTLKNAIDKPIMGANLGGGLINATNNLAFGQSIHYAFGWFKNSDGGINALANGGIAGGAVGWSAIFSNSDCGNALAHEGGHAVGMGHFTGGKAEKWGIEDEYPKDGTNLASHPWGFDSVRNRFRTWYRVNNSGPAVNDNGDLIGKNDPMNHGEANTFTCFPQYTAFHAKKAQSYIEKRLVIGQIDGEIGIYRWQAETAQLEPADTPGDVLPPTRVGVPVVTIIGTFGPGGDEVDPAVDQTYPYIESPYGNVFEFPSPTADDLSDHFQGARHFLEIEYADGSSDIALIGNDLSEGTQLAQYSLNIERSRDPVEVRLYRSSEGYPNVDVDLAEHLHTRELELELDAQLSPVPMVGRGHLGAAPLRLSSMCDLGVNCRQRAASNAHRHGDDQVFFTLSGGDADAPICGDKNGRTVFEVPVVDADGQEAAMVVTAQRQLHQGENMAASQINDWTKWLRGANLEQRFSAWAELANNPDLPTGRWQSIPGQEPTVVMWQVEADGSATEAARWPLRVDIEYVAYEPIVAPVNAEFSSGAYKVPESTVYFVANDMAFGHTTGHWLTWNGLGYVTATAPVIDQDTGERVMMRLRATRLVGEVPLEMNASHWTANHDADTWFVLSLDPQDNPNLVSGHTYKSALSELYVVHARRWHGEPAETTMPIDTLPLLITYDAP